MNEQKIQIDLLPTGFVDIWVVLAVCVLLFALTVAIIRKPIVGLSLLAFLTFGLVPNIYIVGTLTVNITLTLLTLTGFAFEGLRMRSVLPSLALLRHPALLLTFIYSLVMVLSILLHGGDVGRVYPFITNLIMILFVLTLVRRPSDLRMLLTFAFAGCVFVTCAALAKFAMHPVLAFPVRPPDGFYGNRVLVALESIIGVFLGLGLLQGVPRHSPVRWIWLSGICVTGFLALSGASRGVTVGLLILSSVLAIRAVKSKQLAFPLIVAAAIMGILLSYDSLLESYDMAVHSATTVQTAADISSGRVYLYRAALRMFPTAPVFGVGWERFPELWFQYFPAPVISDKGIPKLNVHCSYLQVLVELGLVGFLVYMLWTVSYMRAGMAAARSLVELHAPEAVRLRSMIRGTYLAALGLLLHSLFDNEGRGLSKVHLLLVAILICTSHLATKYRADACASPVRDTSTGPTPAAI